LIAGSTTTKVLPTNSCQVLPFTRHRQHHRRNTRHTMMRPLDPKAGQNLYLLGGSCSNPSMLRICSLRWFKNRYDCVRQACLARQMSHSWMGVQYSWSNPTRPIVS